jgi:ubiquinone biosynthesis protein COQ9
MPFCRHSTSTSTSRRLVSVSSSISATQHKLLQASLAHVATHGWTQDAIAAAVREHKLPLTMIGLVTPSQLVESFMDDCNEQFKRQLQLQLPLQLQLATPKQPSTDHNISSSSNSTNQRLASAIQLRLEYILPYKHQWHQGMALGATNTKTPVQLKEMVQLIADHVYGPNHSTLFERAAIGAMYVVTELHLLADDSPDHSKTWDFLRQRVIQGSATAATTGGISSFVSPDTVVAATAVASSLVGAVGSLAHPAMQGLYSSALPVMMHWMTPPASSQYQHQYQQPIKGTSPTDYEDLPPFPTAAGAK